MENNFYKHKLIFTVLVYHFRDELNKLMEQDGAPPGATILTTNLYKPFTRLDKYPSLLKELERHIEVGTFCFINNICKEF